jgi:hypothetical protein
VVEPPRAFKIQHRYFHLQRPRIGVLHEKLSTWIHTHYISGIIKWLSCCAVNRGQWMVLAVMQTFKNAPEKGMIPFFDWHTEYGRHDYLITIRVPNLRYGSMIAESRNWKMESVNLRNMNLWFLYCKWPLNHIGLRFSWLGKANRDDTNCNESRWRHPSDEWSITLLFMTISKW